jgi:Zn-dependent peptidase ImmA (M78 family)
MTLLSEEKRDEIRAKADAVLTRYRAYRDGLELLRKIARDEGIEILEADLFDIAGALRREGGHWRVYINRQDSPTRQLFTLAHELGHYFLHADGMREFVDSDFVMHRTEDSKYEAEELQANEFAGSLVMPARLIDEKLGQGTPTEKQVLELADRFHVSPLAMALRLQNLGYVVPSLAPSRG